MLSLKVVEKHHKKRRGSGVERIDGVTKGRYRIMKGKIVEVEEVDEEEED